MINLKVGVLAFDVPFFLDFKDRVVDRLLHKIACGQQFRVDVRIRFSGHLLERFLDAYLSVVEDTQPVKSNSVRNHCKNGLMKDSTHISLSTG